MCFDHAYEVGKQERAAERTRAANDGSANKAALVNFIATTISAEIAKYLAQKAKEQEARTEATVIDLISDTKEKARYAMPAAPQRALAKAA